MKGIEDTLAEIGDVHRSDQVPDLLVRLAHAYGMKTFAYLETGTLDRQTPRREPYLAVTYSSEWVEHYRSRLDRQHCRIVEQVVRCRPRQR